MMESEKVVRQFLDLANSHPPDVLDKLQNHLAENMTYTSPITGPTDRNGMRGVHSAFFAAFPDYHYAIDRVVGHGDTVVVETTFKGTHRGDLMGIPPTNKHVALPLAFVVDVKEGKVQKWNSYFDVASVMRQIGVQK